MKLHAWQVTIWGKDYDVTPYLLDEVFGDGQQVIGIAPINFRPKFYVVRVDSKCNLKARNGYQPNAIHNITGKIREAIREQFGMCCDKSYDGEECECNGHETWPVPTPGTFEGFEWFGSAFPPEEQEILGMPTGQAVEANNATT